MVSFLFVVCAVLAIIGFICLFEEMMGGVLILLVAWGIFMGATELYDERVDAQKATEQVVTYKQQVEDLKGQVAKLRVHNFTLEEHLASAQEEVKAANQATQTCQATRELTQNTVKGIQEILEN